MGVPNSINSPTFREGTKYKKPYNLGHRSTHRVDWLWLGNNVPECPSCCRDVLFGFISSGLCLQCIVLLYCAVLCLLVCIVLCASFDFYGYIKDTHGSRGEGRQKMAPSDQRSNIYVASNPKNSNLKVFLTNQNLARILIQTIWEEKIICTVKCQLFVSSKNGSLLKRHDLKYGISAKYYNWDFSSAGQF